MCGFVGFVDKTKDKDKTIKKMADLIKHRGPDSDGYYTDADIALGFRRLSIIDLEGGTQPIYNEEKDKLIFFNGEIYNYKYLKEDLIEKGHKFSTNTDTEVVLHGYEEYKEDFLLMLRGMFAFVIYDLKTKELFGARDFYGIKPLYYAKMKDSFMFGSEIKSFLAHPKFKKELNRDMLEQYLTFQYSVGTDTFFKNVYKLTPGHYFKYKNGKLNIKRYYEIKFEPDNKKKLEEWEKVIREVIDDSIEAHKVSDVEVGSFLSSGVDSSLIATLSNVDKTFTVGYSNKKYSEIDYAKDLSKKINVTNISKEITKEEYFEKFPMIEYYFDEPLADPSAVALYFVANTASKHVKVALSGEGSDEIFGGYNIYHEPYSVSWYYKIPYFIRRFIGICVYPFRHHRGFNFLYRRSRKLEDRYIGNAFMFEPVEVKKILSYKTGKKTYKDFTKPFYDKCKNYDDVTKMQYIDFNFWLIGDILLKADKMKQQEDLTRQINKDQKVKERALELLDTYEDQLDPRVYKLAKKEVEKTMDERQKEKEEKAPKEAEPKKIEAPRKKIVRRKTSDN